MREPGGRPQLWSIIAGLLTLASVVLFAVGIYTGSGALRLAGIVLVLLSTLALTRR